MPVSNEYFDVESDGPLGILKIKPYRGVALSEISYSHAVYDAIQAFESESKSVLLVCVPAGNFAPERMDAFWEDARHAPPDERSFSAPHCHPTNVPLQVRRLETGVVRLLKLLQEVNLFKVIAVEGNVDFDMLGLMLAFDGRFCSRTTVFENRILDRGMSPGFGVLWYLSRHLGQAATIDLILNQRSISAEEALQMKLVTHIANEVEVSEQATSLAKAIAAKPIAVLQALVKTMNYHSAEFETYLDKVGGGFRRLPLS